MIGGMLFLIIRPSQLIGWSPFPISLNFKEQKQQLKQRLFSLLRGRWKTNLFTWYKAHEVILVNWPVFYYLIQTVNFRIMGISNGSMFILQIRNNSKFVACIEKWRLWSSFDVAIFMLTFIVHNQRIGLICRKYYKNIKKTKSFDNTKAAEQINSLKVLILYTMNRRALYLINILKYILIIIFHVS